MAQKPESNKAVSKLGFQPYERSMENQSFQQGLKEIIKFKFMSKRASAASRAYHEGKLNSSGLTTYFQENLGANWIGFLSPGFFFKDTKMRDGAENAQRDALQTVKNFLFNFRVNLTSEENQLPRQWAKKFNGKTNSEVFELLDSIEPVFQAILENKTLMKIGTIYQYIKLKEELEDPTLAVTNLEVAKRHQLGLDCMPMIPDCIEAMWTTAKKRFASNIIAQKPDDLDSGAQILSDAGYPMIEEIQGFQLDKIDTYLKQPEVDKLVSQLDQEIRQLRGSSVEEIAEEKASRKNRYR